MCVRAAKSPCFENEWQVTMISSTMKLLALLILLPAAYAYDIPSVNASFPSERAAKGVCNVAACGCSPYRKPWCTKRNAFVHCPWCQVSRRRCVQGCNQVWCRKGPAPPKPPAPSPSPPPPKMKVCGMICRAFCLTYANSQYILLNTH